MAIGCLVEEVARVFIANEKGILGGDFDQSLVKLIPKWELLDKVEHISRKKCYRSKEVLELELAGYEILGTLLDEFLLTDRKSKKRMSLHQLLPDGPKALTEYAEVQRVTDHLSGMTDSYAVNLYRRIRGIALPRGAPR